MVWNLFRAPALQRQSADAIPTDVSPPKPVSPLRRGVVFYESTSEYPAFPCLVINASDTVVDYIRFFLHDATAKHSVDRRDTIVIADEARALKNVYLEEFKQTELSATLQEIAERWLRLGDTYNVPPPPPLEPVWTWVIEMMGGRNYSFTWTDEDSARQTFDDAYNHWHANYHRALRSVRRHAPSAIFVSTSEGNVHRFACAHIIAMSLKQSERRKHL